MSDRLALSATFSVMMMALYVLFGAEAARMPIGPDAFRTSGETAAPSGSLLPEGLTIQFD